MRKWLLFIIFVIGYNLFFSKVSIHYMFLFKKSLAKVASYSFLLSLRSIDFFCQRFFLKYLQNHYTIIIFALKYNLC